MHAAEALAFFVRHRRWGVAAASAKVRREGTMSAFPAMEELANLRA